MKQATKFFAIFLIFSLTVLADSQPQQVNIALKKAYLPVGFDNNDNVQLMGVGIFNNTCYRIGPTIVHKDVGARTVQLQQTAYEYGFECLQIMVPFSKVVDIGILDEGDWKVEDAASGQPLGTMPITRAKSAAPDDYLYAPIDDAYLTHDAATGKNLLYLEGQYTTRCSRMKEVMVSYYPEIIVVQPVMEQVGEHGPVMSEKCGAQISRFQQAVSLKNDLKGTYLLHVRSLHGQAVNKLVTVP